MESKLETSTQNEETQADHLSGEDTEEFLAYRNLYQDLAMNCILAIIGVVVILLSFFQAQPDYSFEPIGLVGLPIALGVIVLVLSIWQGIQNLIKIRKGIVIAASDRSANDEGGIPATPVRPFIIMGICVGWMLLTPVIGFIIATPVAIFFSLYFMEYRKYFIAAVTSLVFTGLCFYLFGVLLRAPIPEGVTAGLLRVIGI